MRIESATPRLLRFSNNESARCKGLKPTSSSFCGYASEVDILSWGQIVRLETVESGDGALTVVEPSRISLFPIKRVYFIHSMSSDAQRGGHAHRELHQLIIAATGQFSLDLERFGESKNILMDRPTFGCYVPPWTWRDITSFSNDAVCLVLASEVYDENDYIREYEVFIKESRGASAE